MGIEDTRPVRQLAMKNHFQPANDAFFPAPAHISFTRFPLLPKELRLKIWTDASQRQRLLKVNLKSRERCSKEVKATFRPILGDEKFCTYVEGHKAHSKFLRVNRESREEVLRIYRVHIPCVFTKSLRGNVTMASVATLYFNPEQDHLHIQAEWTPTQTFPEFLYHLKYRYDPHRVGLLNLMIDGDGPNVNNVDLMGSDDSLSSDILAAWTETLAQLRSVYFVSFESTGRVVHRRQPGCASPNIYFNETVPIRSQGCYFERTARDPRPIFEGLKRLYAGNFSSPDPRHRIRHWFQALEKWNVKHTHEVEYRFVVAYEPPVGTAYGPAVSDRASAQAFLKWEDDEYSECEVEEWNTGPVAPAFGFWLFPLTAFGLMQEEGVSAEQGYRDRTSPILDLTGHWPELAVMYLA